MSGARRSWVVSDSHVHPPYREHLPQLHVDAAGAPFGRVAVFPTGLQVPPRSAPAEHLPTRDSAVRVRSDPSPIAGLEEGSIEQACVPRFEQQVHQRKAAGKHGLRSAVAIAEVGSARRAIGYVHSAWPFREVEQLKTGVAHQRREKCAWRADGEQEVARAVMNRQQLVSRGGGRVIQVSNRWFSLGTGTL